MKQFLAFTCCIFISLTTTTAQTNWPDNFYLDKLENGLEVLTIEDPSVPLVTIELAVKTGSFTEDASTNGLTHLYEHLFFKANERIPTEDSITSRIQELGLVFNATTSVERANYTINLSSDRLAEGLQFMNAAMRYPDFNEASIQSEFPVIESEFQRAESNPIHFLINDINEDLWGEHASRSNALGSKEVITNATPDQLRQMHERYYVPNNSILIIAGDVSHEETFQHCREIFGDWKAAAPSPHEQFPVPEFTPLTQSKGVITVNDKAESPIIITGFRGPTTSSDLQGTYAADVLTYLLSQSNSKLNEDLVASGLAHQVGVGYTTQKYAAPFTFFLVPKTTGIPDAVAALEENLRKMNNPDYFSDEEIEQAKRMLTIQELYSRETASEVVHNISYWWASADINYFADYTQNIQAVTRADLTQLVNQYITGQPNVTGILLTYEMKDILGMNAFQPLKTQ